MSPERFEAMGVDVLVGGATAAELEEVGLLFEKLDRTFSRFRPESEPSRVNAATAEFVAASPMFVRVLALALDAARRTDGLVDPTLGAAIEAAGYDRDFGELTDDERPPGPRSRSTSAPPRPSPASSPGARAVGCGRRPQPPSSRLPHAQGDPGGLEAGLFRGEEDSPSLGRPEREAGDAPHARGAGLSLDPGADHANLHALHPASACVLDRD